MYVAYLGCAGPSLLPDRSLLLKSCCHYVAYFGLCRPSLPLGPLSLVKELLRYVAYSGLSLCCLFWAVQALTAAGPLSLVAVRGLLTVVASLLQSLGSRGQGLRSCSSRASLPHSMWDLPTRGIKLVSLHCKADSKPLDHHGNPATEIFCKNTQHSANQSSSCCYCLDVQSCPALHDPMDYSPPGSSVHGILQARILEWVAISFPRGSSQPRDQTRVSCIGARFFTTEPPGKPKLEQRL